MSIDLSSYIASGGRQTSNLLRETKRTLDTACNWVEEHVLSRCASTTEICFFTMSNTGRKNLNKLLENILFYKGNRLVKCEPP